MLAFLWLLWSLFRVTLGGPVLHPTWPEEMIPAINGVSNPPFYRLPVFLHASSPLIPQELFRPAEYRGPLPAGLTGLLIPPLRPHKNIPDKATRAVEASCGTDNVSVRVDRWLLRAWNVPSLFRIGSCTPSVVTSRYLYFQYGMLECGGQVQVIGGQLVYSYLLNYTPPSEGYVIRVSPINLPIHCYYNRFHYSYKVGFRPQVQHTTFLKSMKSKLTFSLTVCNAQWEPLSAGHTFYLGEQIYFLAQAKTLLAGERLYVDSCQATSLEDPSSLPKVDIITNYGCMTDSRREDSNSQFLSGGGSVVKFSVDAFLFRGVSQVQYLHCTVSVGLSTSNIAKSCNFNKAADRWEELTASPSVCSCCDSVCADTDVSVKTHVRSPGWRVEQNLEKPLGRLGSFKVNEREHLEQKTTSTDDVKDSQPFPEDRSGFKDEESGINWRQEALLEKVEEQNEKVKSMKDEDSELKTLLKHIMSDEARPLNNVTGPLRVEGSNLRSAVSGLSTDHKSSDETNYSSGIEHNQSTQGSSDVATAVDPIIRLCPHSDGVSCQAVYSASQEGKDVYNGGDGTIYSAVGTEALSAVDGRNSSITFSEKVTPELGLALWSKQVKCVNKSATGTAHTPVGATDSISSEGLGGDVDIQVKESQTEQIHPHQLRDLILNDRESDFISGSRDQALPQTLLTGEGKLNKDSGNGTAPAMFDSIGS